MLVYFWILSAGSLQQHVIYPKKIAEAVRKEWFFANRYLFKWLCDFQGGYSLSALFTFSMFSPSQKSHQDLTGRFFIWRDFITAATMMNDLTQP